MCVHACGFVFHDGWAPWLEVFTFVTLGLPVFSLLSREKKSRQSNNFLFNFLHKKGSPNNCGESINLQYGYEYNLILSVFFSVSGVRCLAFYQEKRNWNLTPTSNLQSFNVKPCFLTQLNPGRLSFGNCVMSRHISLQPKTNCCSHAFSFLILFPSCGKYLGFPLETSNEPPPYQRHFFFFCFYPVRRVFENYGTGGLHPRKQYNVGSQDRLLGLPLIQFVRYHEHNWTHSRVMWFEAWGSSSCLFVTLTNVHDP